MSRRIAFWITSDDLLLEPAVRHPGDGGDNEDCEARNGNARIHIRRDHCRSKNGRTGRKGSQYRQFIHVRSQNKGPPDWHGQPLFSSFLT